MSEDFVNIRNSFFQIFNDCAKKILEQSLDEDVCNNVKFEVSATSEEANAEDLKDGHLLYKTDYAVGMAQSSLVILIPEELVSFTSDVLTGGSGDKDYGGELTEIETNSFSNLMSKILKEVEASFKEEYSTEIAFSADAKILLKENDEYEIASPDLAFDFLVKNTLSLTVDKSFEVQILFNALNLNSIMTDLGVLRGSSSSHKSDILALNINHLKDVSIEISAELGRTRVPIKYALALVKGSLVELDTINNSDIKVFANGVEVAYAQIVAIGENFGLKITKIISPEERLGYL